MPGLTDIYTELVAAERDQMEKAAAAHAAAETETDMVKVAAAYDEMGRAMARQYIADMVKAAQEEAAQEEAPPAEVVEEPEEEELARRKAEILARLQEEQGAAEAPPAEAPPAEAPPVV